VALRWTRGAALPLRVANDFSRFVPDREISTFYPQEQILGSEMQILNKVLRTMYVPILISIREIIVQRKK
jgi:hypothetical protein